MDTEKPVFWLYLGRSEAENEEAIELANELQPECEVRTMNVSEVPFFEDNWDDEELPAMVGGQKPGSTKGGGQHRGIDGIRDVVHTRQRQTRNGVA